MSEHSMAKKQAKLQRLLEIVATTSPLLQRIGCDIPETMSSHCLLLDTPLVAQKRPLLLRVLKDVGSWHTVSSQLIYVDFTLEVDT